VQLEGKVTYLAYYLLKLAEHAIDVGCCAGTTTRPQVLQRQACQERTFCNPVQHAKAPGNADIVTRPGVKRAAERGDVPSRVVFRSLHSRAHALALLAFAHRVRASPLREWVTRAPLPGHPPKPGWREEEA
jgi:hypothetical protein